MRVYQINVVCGSGSTGRIAVDLSKEIESVGGQCRIAYGRGEAPETVDAIKISNKFDLYWHALMTRITDRHGLYSKRATKKLIRDIEEYAPDIIHLHNIHGYFLNYEILFHFLKIYDKPVVWTMHDCWAFTGHCAHYDSVRCEQWKTQCSRCPNIKGYPSSINQWNVDYNYRKKKKCFSNVADLTIVAPSAWLKRQVETSFFSYAKCKTIHNGIDLTNFRPGESNLQKRIGHEKKMLLGVASVWTKNKGLEDFVKLRSMLDDEYVICMIGLSIKQINKMPNGIIAVERTNDVEELAQYYAMADIFLNLTYEDTFPTTNIEALACGTPVITYRTGGSPEAITDSCGVVFEKGDLEGIVNMITQSLSKKEFCSAKCVERSRYFEQSLCYHRYIDLYKELLYKQ